MVSLICDGAIEIGENVTATFPLVWLNAEIVAEVEAVPVIVAVNALIALVTVATVAALLVEAS